MSSAICQNFVQNAWKKELCSNCFKSKDEHAEKPKPKPIQLVSTEKVEGIIRNGKKLKPKLTVHFLKELTEVIGYGGEDWCSENGDEEEDSDSSEDEAVVESDEDESTKELKRITKENTDFNTTSLGEVKEVKKTYPQLLLGKPVVDASGKKQTLLVSVTPFGEDSSTPVRKFNTAKSLSHIPIAKNNKDIIAENKTSNVVLTSYSKNEEEKFGKEEKSLLDEISETLEKSKNPIQIMAKKKIQKDIILTVSDSNKENISQEVIKEKDVKKIETKDEEVVLETKAIVTEKKISLSRTPALKRDVEKPVVYQTATAKIEILNTKNLKLNKETVNKAKTEVNNNEKTELFENKNEKKEVTNNIISTTNLIKAEILNSRSEISESKEKKDEINTNVAEKSSVEEKAKVTNSPPVSKYNMPFSQSREQAGKPDGREDPVATELPPLPITPPPTLETQTSFLHSPAPPIYEKPKVPSKPATVLIRKPPNPHLIPSQPMSTFNNDKPCDKLPLSKQDSTDSDSKSNKRRAPKPPEESITPPVYTRNSTGLVNIDSPVVREKEKRERASSCTPKMLGVSDVLDENDYSAPEPAPRKSLSISTDSLTAGTVEEKRKEKHKGRFSLKKFLRMGSSKDLPKVAIDNTVLKVEESIEAAPQPKPRLVIVHPSELNGAKVEVLAKPILDQMDFHSQKHEYSFVNGDYEPCSPKATKPPPPPRNFSEISSTTKPNLPHPPKSIEILNKQRQISRNGSNTKKAETVYANIGEVRSAIVPNKPVRTASMREREAQQQKQLRRNMHNYEPINIRGKDASENVYDYINSTRSSSPDSDSSRDKNSPKNKTVRLGKRSESSIDVSGEYFKYSNIPRSMSLTYCGSETESEIYSPYSFYGSESEVTEDDHDWIQNGRTHKLRSRKGRSIVHKNLEDNYGAVIVANHEALAQVLENILQQSNHIQPALRGLKTSSNLRWTDFSIKSGITPSKVGRRVFHQALWGAQHVTLVVNAGTVTSSTLSLGTFNLTPVTEFSDLVPQNYLTDSDVGKDSNKQIQATVGVLPWLQVNTIESFSEVLKTKAQNHEDMWKDANFVMLQLVNALKTLQAQGIEELPLSLNCFVLCKDVDRDTHHRLCVLQGLGPDMANKTDEEYGTLCMCALKALNLLHPSPKITPLIHSLLNKERAVSLTQVKSVLEFSLWGPSDVCLGSTIRERELALQRWLDLQRATVLHGLVCARVQLTVYEECHLLFLVRSNARMMCDASLLIESSNMKHCFTSNHK
ncbi:uncharacterized protein LOC108915033 [Anoplophora glabripennis]|uniref:uncharacterized protein LOC108915033 n=1 Tax=Anoplophora glabripennis TaxID=217634 RepID=UPI00087491DE|nr:uncharacterized protein LOC108915033 [Anoplophora glabripennis]XP_018576498.1 uncharacterized protein LOC108915033 [Anoplophora glabripennis]XP_018576499.1 uncharacterized protein LOC108915033 [Anoplophora glabripennis]